MTDGAEGAAAVGPEYWGGALEACRQYLLLVAGERIGNDLHAKGGASDLVQETFLEAQRDLERFRGRSPDELRLWLRRILLNNVSNFARRYRTAGKRRVSGEVSLEAARGAGFDVATDSSSSPVGHAIRREQAEAVARSLERLSERERNLIVWHHRERCTFEEIGQRLGLSADAARVAWARAVKRLQGLIR
jgi:RNA polymerase sigma-70 factor (ECF subfamily)